MTREQIERANSILRIIENAEKDLARLREMKPDGAVFICMGKYGDIFADEDLLKRLIAVCIAHNENKLSKLEEELKKI